MIGLRAWPTRGVEAAFGSVTGHFLVGGFVGNEVRRGVPVLLIDIGDAGPVNASYRVSDGLQTEGLELGDRVMVSVHAQARMGRFGPFVAYRALGVKRLCPACGWNLPDMRRAPRGGGRGRLCHACAERLRRRRRRSERSDHGSQAMYRSGCRCEVCSDAQACRELDRLAFGG